MVLFSAKKGSAIVTSLRILNLVQFRTIFLRVYNLLYRSHCKTPNQMKYEMFKHTLSCLVTAILYISQSWLIVSELLLVLSSDLLDPLKTPGEARVSQ